MAEQDVFEAKLRLLTPVQTRILSQVARGFLNKQIAYQLGIAESTVKSHVTSILQRLSIRSRTQAAVRFSIVVDRELRRRAGSPLT